MDVSVPHIPHAEEDDQSKDRNRDQQRDDEGLHLLLQFASRRASRGIYFYLEQWSGRTRSLRLL